MIALLTALTLCSSQIFAGDRRQNRYINDAIGVGGKLVRIMIDPDSGKVAYFWDDNAQRWSETSLCQTDLDKSYQEKIRFQEMQAELNEMKNQTWDDRYHR